MVVEHQLFAAEAEIRWLDQVEASVARHGAATPPTSLPDGIGLESAVPDETVRGRR